MKFTLFALLILAFRISCFAQLKINSDGSLGGQLFVDEQGLQYYNKGVESFEKSRILEADSLFTLALCTYKNEDVYFNRAMTKVLLKDTIGYCSDLKIAAYSFYDKMAAKFFNHSCCSKVDTIYYDKKGVLTNKTKYRYLEEVLFLKYEKDTIGFVHHKYNKSAMGIADYNCGSIFSGMVFRNTDIVGMYDYRFGVKTYFFVETPTDFMAIFNKDGGAVHRSWIDFKSKYGNLKPDKNTEIGLGVKFFVDQTGQISNIRLVEVIPAMVDEKIQMEMEKDIRDMIGQCPKLEPAKMVKENVCYEPYILLKF